MFNQFMTSEIAVYRDHYMAIIASGDPASIEVVRAQMMLESANAELEIRELNAIAIGVLCEIGV